MESAVRCVSNIASPWSQPGLALLDGHDDVRFATLYSCLVYCMESEIRRSDESRFEHRPYGSRRIRQ